MAAAAGDLLAGKTASKTAEGLIRTVINALEHPIISLHWSRDPKDYKKFVLTEVDVKITTGLVLGGIGLAMLWEVGSWFANALSKYGGGDEVVDAVELVTGLSFLIPLTDIFGNIIKDPTTGAQKTVNAPPTAGAAYNALIRNGILAGPGPLIQALMNQVANYTTAPNPVSQAVEKAQAGHYP